MKSNTIPKLKKLVPMPEVKPPLDVCQLCMDFYHKFDIDKMSTDKTDQSIRDLVDEYPSLMHTVLKETFGISSKTARTEIIDTLGQGNWEHLWETEKEQAETNFEIARSLLGEIFYCSDRWSWDRVLRTNWLYLRLYNKMLSKKWETEHHAN